jgi:hypothetical protein
MQLAGVPQSGSGVKRNIPKHGVRIEIDSFSAEAACCAFVHILTEKLPCFDSIRELGRAKMGEIGLVDGTMRSSLLWYLIPRTK